MKQTLAWLAVLFLLLPRAAAGALPEAKPDELGLDLARLARIDDAINDAIAAHQVPGAVVLVGRRGKVAYAKAYGQRQVEPEADREAMTRDTIFDMASLTKPVATAASVMILLERGKLRLTDTLGRHLPELARKGKGAITIDQLLRHRSGLVADNPESDYADGPEKAWERISDLELTARPGERFVYSDVNYIILGRLVEKLSGESLDRFAAESIFRPLGMTDTRFSLRPGQLDASWPTARTAPTERVNGEFPKGVVHDPRARALGGVAGHAGLFSTADDLAVFAQMMLDEGKARDGPRILAPLTVRLMTDAADTPAHQRRGLGWDVDTGYSAPRGSLFGPASFGHTGFTGTSLWIDPETACFVILLTNRVHPDGKAPSPTMLRSEVATLAAAAIVDAPPRGPLAQPSHSPSAAPGALATPARGPAVEPVACGIDVLVKQGFEGLRGKRVGLVTNHTGRTQDGKATIDVLFNAPGVKLVALFSPEHGIRGVVDARVPDSRDDATGLPVFSLYGERKKPTPESLLEVDALVYDIQDIGARFYTYISTLGLVLEAAGEKGIPLWVLDRPNPIGGVAVAGPVRDDAFASFIAHHALPVRHGMTVGELARLFNAERKVNADLHVVPCEGWRRANLFDRTGLVWVNPSPNMRSLTEALLYPGVALLEASNLATGRGTDTPFERVGAPWIDPAAFSADLNGLGLPGVRFVPARFTPTARQYAGQECGGVQIVVTDWSAIDPLDVGLGLAVVLHRRYANDWKDEGFLRMVADQATVEALRAGKTVPAIRALWEAELAEFLAVRQRYLLYP